MKIKKTIGAALTSLSLVVGLSGFAGATAGTISNTGPGSYNSIKDKVYHKMKVVNNNNLGVDNSNSQTAYTGDAKVKNNTTGGSATTGDAGNANTFSVAATVNNAASSAAMASVAAGGGGSNTANINQTGPDSTNKVSFKEVVKVNVENNNNISVSNTNSQSATSGDAVVVHNTTAGDATSGDASNTNNTTVNFNVSN